MSGYAQIYINKKVNENKYKNNISTNINKDALKIPVENKEINKLKQISTNIKKTERNPSVITFSNFNNINNSDFELINMENNPKNNSFMNSNINNNRINNIIEENKNRIRYRKQISNKNNKQNLTYNKIKINNDSKKDEPFIQNTKKKEINENNKKFNEENKNQEINNISKKEKLKLPSKKEIKKNNEIKQNQLSVSIQSEGNNNFTYDINAINNNNNKENIKSEKSSHNSNLNEAYIKSESSNDFINYTSPNDNNNKFSTIPKYEDTFESINIIKDSTDKILTKEKILYFTHIIFLNNSEYIKSKDCYMMSKTNFLNILKPLSIIKSQLILVEIDLIYDSISLKKPRIIYSQFNQILMKIIQKLYPEQYATSPQLTITYFINKLIKHYNLFFENKIPKDYLYKYQYNSIVKLIQASPNENQIYLISQIILTINEIYEKYFTYELDKNQEYLYKSSENLVKFCRDFELIPQIINSTQAVTYYNLIIHIEQIYDIFKEILQKVKFYKNKGKMFTLYHFILFLLHMSLYTYTKLFGSKSWSNQNDNITKESKLLLFLEKLEHSKGMSNFLSKLYTPRTKPLSLIPPRNICLALGLLDKEKKKTNESLDDVFFKEKESIDEIIEEKALLEE